jgi:hypothetical protein
MGMTMGVTVSVAVRMAMRVAMGMMVVRMIVAVICHRPAKPQRPGKGKRADRFATKRLGDRPDTGLAASRFMPIFRTVGGCGKLGGETKLYIGDSTPYIRASAAPWDFHRKAAFLPTLRSEVP